MKMYGEKPRQGQAEALRDLRALGYQAEYFDLWQHAAEAIVKYMSLLTWRPIEPPLWLNLYTKAQAALKEENARRRATRKAANHPDS